MTKGQWQCMRGVVADRAIAVIEEYRGGRFHGREVSCILAEMFEAANDSFERMMLLHGEKPDTANAAGELRLPDSDQRKETK